MEELKNLKKQAEEKSWYLSQALDTLERAEFWLIDAERSCEKYHAAGGSDEERSVVSIHAPA